MNSNAALDYSPEYKTVWGRFKPNQEFKTLHLEGDIEVGVAEGLLATWDLDEGNDRFHRGAFLESIQEHKQRNNRQIRLSHEHDDLVGGFPIQEVEETSEGLAVVAHINLDHTLGKNDWSLVKQRVLVDFSIGFSAEDWMITDEDIREIFKARIWHGSLVGEPMNRAAQITSVKSLQGLPIASEDFEWLPGDAWNRVQESGMGSRAGMIGRQCVCDIVEGKLTVIPEALASVAKNVKDPESIRAVERMYAQMKKASPFDRSSRQYWGRQEIETITQREVESILSERMSRKSARQLASRFEGLDTSENVENRKGTDTVAEILKDLKAARASH